ncbi:hypothetical protein [Thalassospira aquimaris]|uniref:Terminase small subunit n=1 Tax=Thalassospira aquimaris TaxID=3037796 RepID=A0ABT6GGF9_9PROT|nr:hypothetical protein [Thalassospira sp. FZY0004]MDG4721164.1 hypothetical protein [Thalassospira sp. FZY0004]
MSEQKYTKIKKPADFKPEAYFSKDWKVEKFRGKPRCPAWSGQRGAQCANVAGAGTKRKGEVGACCKNHGGASDGPPLGSTNAANPDKPRSKYISLKQLEEIKQFEGVSDVDIAEMLAKVAASRVVNIASEAAEGQSTAQLLAAIAVTDRALRSKKRIEMDELKISEIRERQGKDGQDEKDASKRDRAQSAVDEVNEMFSEEG